jgi:hypothetical protein
MATVELALAFCLVVAAMGALAKWVRFRYSCSRSGSWRRP